MFNFFKYCIYKKTRINQLQNIRSTMESFEKSQQQGHSQSQNQVNQQKQTAQQIDIDRINLQFNKIDQRFQPHQNRFQVQNQINLELVRQRQDRQFLDSMNDQLQQNTNMGAYLEPYDRRGPYKNNILKNFRQLSRILNDTNIKSIDLGGNAYSNEQIKAILYSSKGYYDEQNRIWNLRGLKLMWVRNPNIIHYLQFKRYLGLQTLNIIGNYVESIELLCQLQFPFLQQIYLQTNKIASTRPFRRARWPNIKIIDMHANLFSEVESLRCLGSKNLVRINISSTLTCNLNEIIVACSNSKSQIEVMSTKLVQIAGNPFTRRRNRFMQFTPGFKKVKYI